MSGRSRLKRRDSEFAVRPEGWWTVVVVGMQTGRVYYRGHRWGARNAVIRAKMAYVSALRAEAQETGEDVIDLYLRLLGADAVDHADAPMTTVPDDSHK